VRSSILTLLAIGLALASSGCGALEAARSAQVEKQMAFEHRVDTAHIWVTTQAAPVGKPYSTLGEINYTETFSPDAIDEAQINDKLKKIALQKWPDMIDAIVDENQRSRPTARRSPSRERRFNTTLQSTAPPCNTLTTT
jgi:hypothetical protein